MSIKDLGDGWTEYWFYYGNANWPSDGTYRYNESLRRLLIRSEKELPMHQNETESRIDLNGIHLIPQNDGTMDATIHIYGTTAYLHTWIEVDPKEHVEDWEFFQREMRKE